MEIGVPAGTVAYFLASERCESIWIPNLLRSYKETYDKSLSRQYIKHKMTDYDVKLTYFEMICTVVVILKGIRYGVNKTNFQEFIKNIDMALENDLKQRDLLSVREYAPYTLTPKIKFKLSDPFNYKKRIEINEKLLTLKSDKDDGYSFRKIARQIAMPIEPDHYFMVDVIVSEMLNTIFKECEEIIRAVSIKEGKIDSITVFGETIDFMPRLNNEGEHNQEKIVYENAVYYGDVKDGMPNGLGTMFYADGGKYIGSFVLGVLQGYGKYSWANGDLYEGDFQNNLLHGKGEFTWANGNKHSGTWEKNIIIE